jgi:hypothetical protein
MNARIELARLHKAAQAARDNEGMTVEDRKKLTSGVDFLLGCAVALWVLVLIVYSAPIR